MPARSVPPTPRPLPRRASVHSRTPTTADARAEGPGLHPCCDARGQGGRDGNPRDEEEVVSDRRAVAEELLILVVASLAEAEVLEALDELDGLDPLHLLEAELVLVP